MVVGKVVVHLCLTLLIKEYKFSVEQSRVVTTLNLIVVANNHDVEFPSIR